MTDDLKETEQADMTGQTTNSEAADQADKEWEDLRRELETLGEQVRSLRDHAGALGETVLGNIELRFQDVLSRAHAYRNTTESQMDALRKLALSQAGETQKSLRETGMKSAEAAKDKAREMWDRAEPLRQGAQEVGQGFVRAWSELAGSFGKAAEKMQADRTMNTAENGESKPKENFPS